MQRAVKPVDGFDALRNFTKLVFVYIVRNTQAVDIARQPMILTYTLSGV